MPRYRDLNVTPTKKCEMVEDTSTVFYFRADVYNACMAAPSIISDHGDALFLDDFHDSTCDLREHFGARDKEIIPRIRSTD